MLSFLWSILLAYHFGTSASMDAYMVVINFVNLFNNVILRIQNNALIPFLFEFKDEQSKRHVVAEISRFSLLLFSFLSVNFFFLSRPLIQLIAPGLSEENTNLASDLLRIISPSVLLLSFIGLNNSLLEHLFRFTLSSFINVLRHLLALGILFFLIQRLEIYGVPVSLVSSLFITAIISYFIFVRNHFSVNLFQRFNWSVILDYIRLIAPLLLCNVLSELVYLVRIFVASFLNVGSISYLTYADYPLIFIVIISSSVISISFPMLSRQNQAENSGEFLKIFYKIFEILIYGLVPLAAFIFIFAEPVVWTLFKRGKFTAQDVTVVADTIRCYIYVLVGGPLGTYLTYVFYSRKKSLQTLPIIIISVIMNILMNIVLSPFFMHYGVAAASSVSIMIGNIVFLWSIKRIVPEIDRKYLLKRLGKIVLSSLLSTVIIYFVKSHISFMIFQSEILHQISLLSIYAILTGIIYGTLCYILKIDIQLYILSESKKALKGKFWKKPIKP